MFPRLPVNSVIPNQSSDYLMADLGLYNKVR